MNARSARVQDGAMRLSPTAAGSRRPRTRREPHPAADPRAKERALRRPRRAQPIPSTLRRAHRNLPAERRRALRLLPRGVAPPQAIAIDENHPAQRPRVINARLAMALRKERRQPLHPLVRQPARVAPHHSVRSGDLHHASGKVPSRSMCSGPRAC